MRGSTRRTLGPVVLGLLFAGIAFWITWVVIDGEEVRKDCELRRKGEYRCFYRSGCLCLAPGVLR